MIKKLSSKKAFTIIEVVLVLGIAGLILLAVFVAVPALQRSKRNQIRKNDMARIMQAVVAYQSSHSGKAPIYYYSAQKATVGSCDTLANANGIKNCFLLDVNFVKKYIDSDAKILGCRRDEEHGGKGKNQNPETYSDLFGCSPEDSNSIVNTTAAGGEGAKNYFTCEAGNNGCGDFRDPDGTMYVIKTEGLFYMGNEQLFDHDHVIHMAAYSKCSSTGGVGGDVTGGYSSDANGVTVKTKDANDVTIVYRLEGSSAPFCIDNQ